MKKKMQLAVVAGILALILAIIGCIVLFNNNPASTTEPSGTQDSSFSSEIPEDSEPSSEPETSVHPEHECDYSIVKYDEETHWFECSCGAVLEGSAEEHWSASASCVGEAVCDVCHQIYTVKSNGHNYTNLVFDDATYTYYYECACGAKSQTKHFAIETSGDVALAVGEKGQIRVTQIPSRNFKVTYSSSNKAIATVTDEGVITAISVGTAKITIVCGDQTKVITVEVKKGTVPSNPSDTPVTADVPKLDGIIEKEFYGDNFMSYVANGQNNSYAGLADVDMYWYEGKDGLYLAFDIVGATALLEYEEGTSAKEIRKAGSMVLLVKNPATGEGFFYRIYANGDVRKNTLINLAKEGNPYGAAANNTAWTTTTDVLSSDIGISKVVNDYNKNIVNSYVVEIKLSYKELGVSSASELMLSPGWTDLLGADTVYTKDGVGTSMAKLETPYVVADASYWYTLAEIKENKSERNIRLDGYIDEAYKNSFAYEADVTTNGRQEISQVTVYWYEEEDCIYFAFDVLAGRLRSLTNTNSGTQGSASVLFGVTKTGTTNGKWFRASASALQYKTIEKVISDKTLYSAVTGRTDYVRGNEGALCKTKREDIERFVVEIRVDFEDYDVTSADQLSFMIGGMNAESMDEWFYQKDGSIFVYTDTGNKTYPDSTGPAYVAIADVNNETYQCYWNYKDLATLADQPDKEFELPGISLD